MKNKKDVRNMLIDEKLKKATLELGYNGVVGDEAKLERYKRLYIGAIGRTIEYENRKRILAVIMAIGLGVHLIGLILSLPVMFIAGGIAVLATYLFINSIDDKTKFADGFINGLRDSMVIYGITKELPKPSDILDYLYDDEKIPDDVKYNVHRFMKKRG